MQRRIKNLTQFKSLLLKEEFRREMISEGIKKASSMRQLGRILGYTSHSPNWSIKQILNGNQYIPTHRLLKLIDFLKIDEKKVLQNIMDAR